MDTEYSPFWDLLGGSKTTTKPWRLQNRSLHGQGVLRGFFVVFIVIDAHPARCQIAKETITQKDDDKARTHLFPFK